MKTIEELRDFLLLNLRAIRGRAYPRVVGANREPSWIFWGTILPLFTVGGLVFYYKSLQTGMDEETQKFYIGLVVLSGAMTAFWLNVMWSIAAQLYWEREIGNLQLYLTAPCSRVSILLGMSVGGMTYTTVRATSSLLIGAFIFDVTFILTQPLELITVFLVTMISLYGLGMLFASLFLIWGRQAWHLSELMMEPVYLVSGFWFPARVLGTVVASIASLLPITLGLDAMRQLLFDYSGNPWLMPYQYEIAFLAVTGVFFYTFAIYALRFMERKGKETGRLIMRWQ